ncbi:exodeoxyribonuclease VII large subunit [Candidatus Parcubacteria bacterium]|nr:exodeoxyribonuclease VII large subunit [Candidatus Parcubacteria bacterium]
MTRRTISVSEFLALVNETLRLIPSQEFLIEGEVSDFRISQEKWVSFDLKDETQEAVLKCFMTIWALKTPIENGMRVQALGYPNVYDRYGQFKLTVQEVTPVGEGALQRAYQLLKQKLAAEGLFDVSRKRPLPRFPKRIGLITSRDAAAYGDFLRILNNRWSGVEILHAHVHVQGREAVGDILSALSALSAISALDVIVLTRGGGGLEDLHAFNDEHVARAVFASPVPVVCAVGHERDESLCDFVADVRASTPSNAAERVVPSRQEVIYEMEAMVRHVQDRLMDTVSHARFGIDRAAQTASRLVVQQTERLGNVERRFAETSRLWLVRLREGLEGSLRVLQQVDPARVLSRGYGIVRAGGRIIRDACALEIGQEVRVQLSAGAFEAEVKSVAGKGQLTIDSL